MYIWYDKYYVGVVYGIVGILFMLFQVSMVLIFRIILQLLQ